MKLLTTPTLTLAVFVCALSLPAAAQALNFNVEVAGTSRIVEVIDPNGPVLRLATEASGGGSFGIQSYTSTDIVNMANGQGSGSNRFVADDGAELRGHFTVQLSPTATPGVLQIEGLTTFSGGSGRFAGATGTATFSGIGTFINATDALANFVHHGSIALVPEPAHWLLLLAGLGTLLSRVRARRGRGSVNASASVSASISAGAAAAR